MTRKYYSMLMGGTLTMMVVSILLMSDSLIAGIVIGADAVAGITLVTPLYSAAAFAGSVFSLGTPIIYSRKMGMAEKEEADRAFGVAILVSLVLSILMLLVVSLLGSTYLRSYHPSEAVYAHAAGYLVWMKGTMFLLPFQLLLSGMVYGDGDEAVSTAANAVQGAGNIAGSLILARTMGTAGIGLASFVFNLIALGILSLHFRRKANTLRPNLFFSSKILIQIVRLSIIDASSYLFSAVLMAVLTWIVGLAMGSRFIILVSVISLVRELQMVFDGIGEAILPIISVYLGEACCEGIRRIYRLAERTAVVEGIIVMIIIAAAAPWVPGVLGIEDPEAAAQAVTGTRILALGSVPISMMYLQTSYELLVGKIGLGLIASGLRDLFIAAPLGIALCLAAGAKGMFAAAALAPLIGWALLMIFTRARYGADAPLFLGRYSEGKTSLLFDAAIEPADIIRIRDEIGKTLDQLNYSPAVAAKTMLLAEELLMSIYGANEGSGSNTAGRKDTDTGRRGKQLLAECSLLLEPEKIIMTIRDNGTQHNMAGADADAEVFRDRITADLVRRFTLSGHHLSVMSFNRNTFEISAPDDASE